MLFELRRDDRECLLSAEASESESSVAQSSPPPLRPPEPSESEPLSAGAECLLLLPSKVRKANCLEVDFPGRFWGRYGAMNRFVIAHLRMTWGSLHWKIADFLSMSIA